MSFEENVCNFVVLTVSVQGPAPKGAKVSTGIVVSDYVHSPYVHGINTKG